MRPILIATVVAVIMAGATNAEPVSPAQVSAAVAAATGTGQNPSPLVETSLNSVVADDPFSADAVGPSSPSAAISVTVKPTESKSPKPAPQLETEDASHHKVSLTAHHRLNHIQLWFGNF